MTNYTKATDFASKDALLTGNPSKLVKGTEIGAEFDAIQSADASSVKGPGVSTDNAVMRWDGTAGYTAQNSGVTITDGNVITATGFTGAVNGTVGATTPSTGAFTTLSASGTATVGPTNGMLLGQWSVNANFGYIQNSSIAVATGNYALIHGTTATAVNALTGGTVDFRINNTTVGQISATGLAVTGALSATNGIEATSAASDAIIGLLATGVQRWQLKTERSTGNFLLYNQTGVSTPVTVTTSGNMGIGVTPTYQLDVRSTLTGTTAGSNRIAHLSANASGRDAYLAFGDNVNANAGMGYLSGALYWYANGAERMRLDTAGNLGIGVTPSTWGDFDAIDIGPATSLYHNGGNASCGFAHNVYHNGANWILKTTAAAGVYSQLAGEHKWYTTPSGAAGTTTILTQSLAVGKGTTLALEGATSAAGTGIAFPATQLASSNANTLDDYEEGTFTPVITFGGASVGMTYLLQMGRYTKIGNRVHYSLYVVLSAKGSSTGALKVGGLPFTSYAPSNAHSVPIVRASNGAASMTGYLQGYVDVNATTMALEKFTAGATSALTDVDTTATTAFIISGTYEAA